MNRAEKIISMLNESTTLEMHPTLNTKLWDGETLKPEVRAHCIKIAEKWKEFANIPPKSTTDLIITGGNAGFWYTPYSDLDIHWIMHRRDFGGNPTLVEDYVLDKKNLFAKEHPNLKIYGYDVELYAQDVKTPFSQGQGVYSILHDKWIQKPKKVQVDFDDPHIQMKVEHYMSRIDHMIMHSDTDAAFERIKEKFKNMRKTSIAKGGEFGQENLIFKELRNRGYLDKMNDFLHQRQDKRFSLFLRKKKNATK
jgi:hypothetical protein